MEEWKVFGSLTGSGQRRKQVGGNALASFLCCLCSRLPLCVLGGWGCAEDERLQIFTTWLTKYLYISKLDFNHRSFIY